MPISVKRNSDGKLEYFDKIGPDESVKVLKDAIRANLAPKFPNGARLVFDGKVLKSRHRLKHYGISDNCIIEMRDEKNWSSSSSGSDSD